MNASKPNNRRPRKNVNPRPWRRPDSCWNIFSLEDLNISSDPPDLLARSGLLSTLYMGEYFGDDGVYGLPSDPLIAVE